MRKNVKKQLALRVLSTAALMAMVSSIATAAFAEEYDLTKGSVTVETKDNGNTYVTQANTETTDHLDTTGVTITSNGEQTSNTITVETAKDQTTNVTLQDVFINREKASDRDSEAALTVKGDGDTNIELNGNNTLSSTGAHAGLEKTDAECSGTLTITDDKNDDGSEKEEKDKYGYSTGGDTGTLAVIGGGSGGAGIGGQGRIESDSRAQEIHDASNITITGGNISAGRTPEGCDYNAHWNPGAGIGGGSHGGDGTNITITGNANVDAYGSYYAAGIGGSDYGSKKGEDGKWYTAGGNGENITISGNAKVTARGWDAAGIGGGEYGDATNITISGNAKVTAAGSNSGGAGIGGGDYGTGSVLITDHADVTAYGGNQGAGIGGGASCGGSVEISGNAKVTAVGANGSAGIGSGDHNAWVKPDRADTKVTISENADVTAVGSYGGAAIGTGDDCMQGKTTINITGGTVTAIGGKKLTSAIGGSRNFEDPDRAQDVTVTINGTTGNTTVNASCWGDQKSAVSTGNGTADIIGYDEDGKSPFGEDGSVIVRMYNHGSYTKGHGSVSKYDGDLKSYNLGDLYQVVHNRKYMEKHPEIVDDFNKLENSDLHDWQLKGEVVEPTLEKDGYADYVCRIDKCGQTKHVVLPKLTPEESGSVETREVGVIYWDAAAQAAPAALQGKVLSADEQTATAEKAQVESLLADKANWKLAEDVGDLMIHPAADAAGTVYEQAVKASGCQYYVIANVTAQ